MKTIWTPAIILVGLVVCFEVYVNSTGSQLPQRVASHFNMAGEADGWMTHDGYQFFLSVLGVALPAFFALMTTLTSFTPKWFVNIPNRDYWLAPERRGESCAYINDTTLWIACLMMTLFAGMHYMTIQANTLTPPHLQAWPFATILGGFLVGTGFLVIRLLRHFAKPV